MAGVSWYAFNFKDYASDTTRLSCEAHGAYIQMIADYYNTKEPLPDDDFILAAVTKLPIEVWKKHRKSLERYFTIANGVWRHERIEREIQEATAKHAESIAKAKAGAAARWEKERAKKGQPKPSKQRSTTKPPKIASGNTSVLLQAKPAQSLSHADLHLHPSITEGGGEAPPEADQSDQIRFITKDFLPSVETSERAKAAGLSVEDVDAEVRKFIGRKQSDGAVSSDWQGSFAEWIEREIAFRKKQAKAPPRIEVNARYTPTEVELDRAVAMFAKNNSTWSRQLGPEPGHLGCRVPAEIIEKHGLDPATGMKKKVAS